jgi:hypothetical protein
MADEKIVVVCDKYCESCFLSTEAEHCNEYGETEYLYTCNKRINVNQGDVVTIEIKRNKHLTK